MDGSRSRSRLPGRKPLKGEVRGSSHSPELRRDRVAVGAAVVIGLIVLTAICAARRGRGRRMARTLSTAPRACRQRAFQLRRNHTFLLGTDELGRTYWSASSTVPGSRCWLASWQASWPWPRAVVGLVAGYLGRAVDTVLSRFTVDVVLSLRRYLVFAIALIAVVGPDCLRRSP